MPTAIATTPSKIEIKPKIVNAKPKPSRIRIVPTISRTIPTTPSYGLPRPHPGGWGIFGANAFAVGGCDNFRACGRHRSTFWDLRNSQLIWRQ